MLPAARSLDPILSDPPTVPPAPAGIVLPRTSLELVRIGMMPAAREGDRVKFMGADVFILEGEPSVRIEGKPAARMTDPIGPMPPERMGPAPSGKSLAKVGRIALGCPTVRIGMSPQAKLLAGAAVRGTAHLPVGSGGGE